MSIFNKSKLQDEIINSEILNLEDINKKLNEFSNSKISKIK